MLNYVPTELKARRQWVLWRIVERGGEKTKLPHQTNGWLAKSNDPSTWNTFDAVVKAYNPKRWSGVGYVFSETDEFCGIDLDGCRDPASGKVMDWAREWIVKFSSYAEVSPSQTGVKIFVRAKSPFDGGKKRTIEAEKIVEKAPGVEVYDKLRYFAVTGLKLSGMSTCCEDRQAVLDQFCASMFPPDPPPHQPAANCPLSIGERAARYLDRLPPAISGQSGHDAAFRAACVLVIGFGLAPEQAYPVFCGYNQRCVPVWSEKEIWHKLRSADKIQNPRGNLRDASPDQWDKIRLPVYREPNASIEDPVTDGMTLQGAAERYLDVVSSGKQSLIELGVADLDYAIGGGVAPGEVVIIAARPSHGKSAVALQILDNCARDGMSGLIISEEMSSLAIGKRVLQFVSDQQEEHWKSNESDVRGELVWHFERRKPVYIAENCRTVGKATATIEWYVRERGVQIAAVDYAQILAGGGKTPYERVTATSIALRGIANQLGITLLVLCQLSRGIESREKFVPKGSDLKESGQLEQDADVIVFLVWPHRINSAEDPKRFQMYVAKNRNRPINQSAITCEFSPSRQMVRHEAVKRVKEFDEWNSAEPVNRWNSP